MVGNNPIQPPDRPRVSILELVVYVMNPSFSPTFINPDFLVTNGVVDSSWELVPPVLVRSTSTVIRYLNGVTVSGRRGHFSVSHKVPGNPLGSEPHLTVENILSVGVAERLMETMPVSQPYSLFTIDPSGYIELSQYYLTAVASSKGRMSDKIIVGGVTPLIESKALYNFDDNAVTVSVSEPEGGDVDTQEIINCEGEFLWYPPDTELQEQREYISQLFRGLASYLELFDELAFRLCLNQILGEGRDAY